MPPEFVAALATGGQLAMQWRAPLRNIALHPAIPRWLLPALRRAPLRDIALHPAIPRRLLPALWSAHLRDIAPLPEIPRRT